MTPEFIRQALGHIAQSHFQGTWPETAICCVIPELEPLPEVAMVAATKRVFMEFPPRLLPAIGKVVEVVRQESVKVNQSSSPPETKSRRDNDNDFRRDQQKFSKLGQRTMKLIEGLYDGVLTKDQYIEGNLAMDATYPGIGFRESATFLISRWRCDDNQTKAAGEIGHTGE
jgi:hypothetical protein